MLLEKGADPAIKDSEGRTAFYYTKDFNVKALLTSYGHK